MACLQAINAFFGSYSRAVSRLRFDKPSGATAVEVGLLIIPFTWLFLIWIELFVILCFQLEFNQCVSNAVRLIKTHQDTSTTSNQLQNFANNVCTTNILINCNNNWTVYNGSNTSTSVNPTSTGTCNVTLTDSTSNISGSVNFGLSQSAYSGGSKQRLYAFVITDLGSGSVPTTTIPGICSNGGFIASSYQCLSEGSGSVATIPCTGGASTPCDFMMIEGQALWPLILWPNWIFMKNSSYTGSTVPYYLITTSFVFENEPGQTQACSPIT